MLGNIIVALLSMAVGFGLGRIKNASKLAAIKTEVTKFETAVVTDASKVVAAIKSHL